MKKKPEDLKQPQGVSRREFGRRAAITLAGGALAATASATAVHALGSTAPHALPPQEEGGPELSAQAQAEVEAKLQQILAAYGTRLTEDQKKRIRRTVTNHVRMLEAIRPIAVANGDAPATVLRLLRASEDGGPVRVS